MSSAMLQTTLQACRAHVRVECAASAEAAVTVLEENQRVDIIVTDIHLPGMSGIEFIQKVREMEAEKGWSKQVLIATSADRESDTHAIEAGADAFIC